MKHLCASVLLIAGRRTSPEESRGALLHRCLSRKSVKAIRGTRVQLKDIYLVGTLPADRNKNATLLSRRVCRVHRKVWTPNDAHLDLAIHNERQANGVLTTTQEALRSVNGVNRPHPYYAMDQYVELYWL